MQCTKTVVYKKRQIYIGVGELLLVYGHTQISDF